MSSPQEMWEALPPITKAWLGSSLASTTMVSFGMLDPLKMAFYMPFIINQFSIWRFFTCFLFFGKFSFGFLMQMFILVRFSAAMEADPFKTSRLGGSVDYLFSLVIMGLMLIVIAWYMEFFFMGSILSFSVLYLWSKRNPDAPTNIWGFALKGSQLPWALLVLNVLMGQSPVMDIFGVAVGHVYYFIVEVVPISQGKTLLKTPEFFIKGFCMITGQTYVNAAGTPAQRTGGWGAGQRLGRG